MLLFGLGVHRGRWQAVTMDSSFHSFPVLPLQIGHMPRRDNVIIYTDMQPLY